MTEKLYYQDVNLKTFTATVLSCEAVKKHGWEIILDRTAFYPEGGGQSGDRGTLNGITVTDTHEQGEDIVHYAAAPIAVGETVTGVLDWQHRFDMMQNHTGEHIVTGVIHARYGCNNVGFHMGASSITIDLDVEFPAEELAEFELAANRIVWADVPVDATIYEHDAAQAVDYRSKKELPGDIRIVTIGEKDAPVDVCACCGTHVTSTGQIGLIKLISVQKFRTGVRVELLCGRRALEYINTISEQNHQISVALSAKPDKTATFVMKLKDEATQMTYRLNRMEEESFARRAEALAGAGDVLLFEEAMEANSVRKLAVAIMERCGGRCAVFAGDDATGYKYAMGQEGGDLRSLTKAVNKALNGRGGGKPFFVQGSVGAKRSEIEAFFQNAE